MNLSLIFEQSLAVQVHFFTVVPAFFIGGWLLFFSTKGAPIHRLLGKIYLALMMITATAAIFIAAEVGPTISIAGLRLGLIHLFVALTYLGVFNAIRGVQLGDIRRHKGAMIGTYVGGLLIAGAFTFVPGRVMYNMFFA